MFRIILDIPKKGYNMTLANYTDLFQKRGGQYDSAMQEFPHARDEEFHHAVTAVKLLSSMRIIDVPAGGGYLQRYLPKECYYQSHEPCTNFIDSTDDHIIDLLPLPFVDNSVDVAFSIAGLHHLVDKKAFFKDVARVVKTKGRFIIADVHKDSTVADFLDNFVGQYNSTGHDGIFLDDKTLQELSSCEWRIYSANRISFHWQFDSKQSLGEFCYSFFDLRGISRQKVIDAVDQILGITQVQQGIRMKWELFYIVADR